MGKETVHIISHSHWDREWYLPLEEHRMRLVELFDDLFDLFETDPEFRSFHLDGQTIVLDDYLEIRPQNRELLKKYIQDGRLIIGPFYILQDDYLITSEANMRNTLLGHLESKKWGQAPKIGYYPDTFGNMGQAPQLLRQAGIDVALFGRGVKPVGFDNQVLGDDQFQSTFSEMIWEGADGSQVLGILFANWYSNGNEIPVDEEDARVFWEKKFADVRKYASTSHYLLMNGCDHQPVQKNLSQALRLARTLYPDIDFVHSSFEEYIAAVKEELPEDLSRVKGELTSQETDGWYTLANTASSRIYLKQANDQASQLLEQVVEPLVVMTGDKVPRDELRYAWKLLLQNAPHDSICGCSVDQVHSEMETRFKKVKQVAHFLSQRSLDRWEKQVDSSQLDGLLFTVFNTTACRQTQLVEVDLLVEQEDFRDGQLEQHFQSMAAISLPVLGLFTSQGQELEATIEDLGVNFRYDLPKDAFRSANFARQIRVRFVVENQAPFSWQTYQVKPIGDTRVNSRLSEQFENDYYRIDVVDGQLLLEDKRRGQAYKDWLRFEDCGDLGNEYIFMAPKNDQPIDGQIEDFGLVYQTEAVSIAKVIHRLQLPIAMETSLEDEQKRLIEFKHRTSQRSQEKKDLLLTTYLTLYRHQPHIRIQTNFHNQIKDHRLRAVFDIGIEAENHLADSIFEVVERPNQPHPAWENPSNPQRHRSFICLSDGRQAMTVSSKGLHEYEILDRGKIALTLLRATGELGDWGYFPTPEAQCLRECQLDYALEICSVEEGFASFQRAQAFQGHLLTKQVTSHSGHLPCNHQFLNHPALEEDCLCVTSLKVAETSDRILLRYYNMSQEQLAGWSEWTEGVDLLEEPLEVLPVRIEPQAIRTEVVGYLEKEKEYGSSLF
ncbi:TPA: alpha-mannosidase [Streptococcus suis]|nr:alpha-mannosidase [Streptococcus suis]